MIDAALTIDGRLSNVRQHPFLRSLCARRRPLNWFFKHKYIISLAGYDTGSNFLLAANSNSVVMKEEDGWQLFYTNEFKPWVHYIPLCLGAQDVDEKLAWAMDNQDRCPEISATAQQICTKFAHKNMRENILRKVFNAAVQDRSQA